MTINVYIHIYYHGGAARRGAWGARTVRATAAAVGPGAARRGAWAAPTVRATAAVGPGPSAGLGGAWPWGGANI